MSDFSSARWQTYLDRDLRISGSVLIKGKKGKIKRKNVDSKRGVAIIPSVSVELVPNNSCHPQYDSEKHFNAIIGKTKLKTYIASLLKCKEENIIDWDLQFDDAQPASTNNNIIYSSRLSTFAPAFASFNAFLDAKQDTKTVQMFAAFGHSGLYRTSASSDFLNSLFSTIFSGKNIDEVKSKSLIIATFGFEGHHPRFIGLSDSMVGYLGKGPVLYLSFRRNFQTDPIGEEIIQENRMKSQIIQKQYQKDLQFFGVTISNPLSLNMNIRTIDFGFPVLSTGSIRETAVYKDIFAFYNAINSLYTDTEEIQETLEVS
ncbi:M18 family aminopeptidase [Histomonas meleagridis]|uniref:M18 family aminopeptidase n=1 Tax=Histomonas meleagridis TaxID=135588 RepID=UPI00355A6A93|nr:M18 family aminopeptidase [Histomonas meleagridis]KAH0799589.1 M18 family aminopeptidase [Histomonas meleagridis]